MNEAVGRAGWNVRHLRHGDSGTHSERVPILKESMRDLDERDADYWARRNPNVVREDTHLNRSMVNDGAGGFRLADNVGEVLDYGDARIGTRDNAEEEDRIANTGRKWNPKSFETSLFVISLPRTLCEEIEDYYPVIDEKSGEPVTVDGEPVMRSRFVARDVEEAREYFMRSAEFLGSNVLTGGTDAIHGIAPNFDEAYPHAQIMADTLGPAERTGELRCDASRMWGSHRDVRDTDDKQEGRHSKMERYQREFREHMAQWYDVELEVAPRSKSSQSREEWAELKDRERIAEAEAEAAEYQSMQNEGTRKRNAHDRAKLDEREAQLQSRESEVADLEASVEASRREVAQMDAHIAEIAADMGLDPKEQERLDRAERARRVIREMRRRIDSTKQVEAEAAETREQVTLLKNGAELMSQRARKELDKASEVLKLVQKSPDALALKIIEDNGLRGEYDEGVADRKRAAAADEMRTTSSVKSSGAGRIAPQAQGGWGE